MYAINCAIIRNSSIQSQLGCVRGQHGRGQGQGSSRPRRRPEVFEAKATKFCPRGPPSLGFLPHNATQRAVIPRRLSVHHSQIQRPTAASCACVLSIVFMALRPLLINHRPTQNFNVLRPDLEAKAKAAHRRGQAQGSSRPRPQNFALEVSSRSRPVLEDPIPESQLQSLYSNLVHYFTLQ